MMKMERRNFHLMLLLLLLTLQERMKQTEATKICGLGVPSMLLMGDICLIDQNCDIFCNSQGFSYGKCSPFLHCICCGTPPQQKPPLTAPETPKPPLTAPKTFKPPPYEKPPVTPKPPPLDSPKEKPCPPKGPPQTPPKEKPPVTPKPPATPQPPAQSPPTYTPYQPQPKNPGPPKSQK